LQRRVIDANIDSLSSIVKEGQSLIGESFPNIRTIGGCQHAGVGRMHFVRLQFSEVRQCACNLPFAEYLRLSDCGNFPDVSVHLIK